MSIKSFSWRCSSLDGMETLRGPVRRLLRISYGTWLPLAICQKERNRRPSLAKTAGSVPNRPGRTAGPWRAIVPGVPGKVGADGRARRPSFIKTAVLWVDGRALQSYWERDLPVGPGRHLDGLTSPTGPWRRLQGPAVTYSPCKFSVRPINR